MTSRARSDALVLFGASGDLAHKKIFPALYAMARHGKLDVPIVGVAKSDWTLDDLIAHARDAIRAAPAPSTRPCSTASRPDALCRRRLPRCRDLR